MTKKELIKRLETTCFGLDHVDPLRLLVDDVIEALREHAMREVQRLGQEIEQEPVAWVSEDVCEGQYIDGRPRKIWWECGKGVGTAFYTTPPQRTWVGLTDKEMYKLWLTVDEEVDRMAFGKAVEAKLKDLNI